MQATMEEILDYAELSRKLKEPVEIFIFGNPEDNFRMMRLNSGVSCPIMRTEDDRLIACEKKYGVWHLLYNFHKETMGLKEIDDISRRMMIYHR